MNNGEEENNDSNNEIKKVKEKKNNKKRQHSQATTSLIFFFYLVKKTIHELSKDTKRPNSLLFLLQYPMTKKYGHITSKGILMLLCFFGYAASH